MCQGIVDTLCDQGVHVEQLTQVNLARYIVEAVITMGLSYRQTARELGVSKSLVAKVIGRHKRGEPLEPRSRAPRSVPARCPAELEQRIVESRDELTGLGVDAGAATIHKRPKSSWIRFEAHLPNECWQADVTHWALADGTGVEILDIIYDHSRMLIASKALPVATATNVTSAFREAFQNWGKPASILTDNGCVFTAWHRGGTTALETECLEHGIEMKHSRPYHPQTCGKVEYVHKTIKRFLAAQPTAATIKELQAQLDFFTDYYNHIRPHRARGRRTPRSAWDAFAKAHLTGVKIPHGAGVRCRTDKVDVAGKITLRRKGVLHHIGIGREHARKRVLVLVKGLNIRVITPSGNCSANSPWTRHATISPPDYPATRSARSPFGRPSGSRLRCPDRVVHDALREHRGAPGRIRTPDQRLRRPPLYPTELRAQARNVS
jgi:transposase InsO family protein